MDELQIVEGALVIVIVIAIVVTVLLLMGHYYG